jgi:UDP-GlcNAc:undecaprenyl-phosphate/decaprenyl-phosphate GlcNAc-1-phosphate transferase
MDDSGIPPNAARALRHLLDHSDTWLHRNLADLFGGVPVADGLLVHSRISTRGLLLGLIALLTVWIVPPAAEWMLRRCGRLASNFRGDRIPQSFGIVILLIAEVELVLDAWLFPANVDRLLWAGCIGAFGLLGLLDDACGSADAKGLRGHLRALVRERRVTTGLLKAAVGAATAVWVGWRLNAGRLPETLLAAGVIALSANAINLLDLRPGRACGGFFAVAVPILIWGWRRDGSLSVPGLLYVAIPALVVWTWDAAGRVMLGDAGSNLLGAALGLGVCECTGTLAQALILAGLVALHVVAERVSITKLIESSRFLRSIDRLTGIR